MSRTRGSANDKVTTNDNRSLVRMHSILCWFTFIIRRQWCKSTLEHFTVSWDYNFRSQSMIMNWTQRFFFRFVCKFFRSSHCVPPFNEFITLISVSHLITWRKMGSIFHINQRSDCVILSTRPISTVRFFRLLHRKFSVMNYLLAK